jgi:hypothetical protein
VLACTVVILLLIIGSRPRRAGWVGAPSRPLHASRAGPPATSTSPGPPAPRSPTRDVACELRIHLVGCLRTALFGQGGSMRGRLAHTKQYYYNGMKAVGIATHRLPSRLRGPQNGQKTPKKHDFWKMVLPTSGHLEKCRYFQTNGGLKNSDTFFGYPRRFGNFSL